MIENGLRLFESALRELATRLVERPNHGATVRKSRHFDFVDEHYKISIRERADYAQVIRELTDIQAEALANQFPAIFECASRHATALPGIIAAGEVGETEKQNAVPHAWVDMQTWFNQVYATCGPVEIDSETTAAVYLERSARWAGTYRDKVFIIPIHGIEPPDDFSTLTIGPGLELSKLTDQIKSEGWFDSWVDYVSTNPRDIANASLGIIGWVGAHVDRDELRRQAAHFLDAIRLGTDAYFDAPDCFWTGHEFSIIGGGLGPVEHYGPIRRRWGPCQKLTTQELSDAVRIHELLRKTSQTAQLTVPIRRYIMAKSRTDLGDSILDLNLALEAMLVPDGRSGEIGYKMSMRGRALLAQSGPIEAINNAKAWLKIINLARNAVAHSGTLDWQSFCKKTEVCSKNWR